MMPLPVERSQGSVSALVARFQNAADRDKEASARESRRSSLVPPGGSSSSRSSASGQGYGHGYSSSNGPSPAASPLLGNTPRLSSGALPPPAFGAEDGNNERKGEGDKEEVLKSPTRAETKTEAGTKPNGQQHRATPGILDRAGDKMKSLEHKLEKVLISDKGSDSRQDKDKDQDKENGGEVTASSPSRPPKSPKRMSSSTTMSALAVPNPKTDDKSGTSLASDDDKKGQETETTEVPIGDKAVISGQPVLSHNKPKEQPTSAAKSAIEKAVPAASSKAKDTPSATDKGKGKGKGTPTSSTKRFPTSSPSTSSSPSTVKTGATKPASKSATTTTPAPRSRLSSSTSTSTATATITPRARVSLGSGTSASASRRPASSNNTPPAARRSVKPDSTQAAATTPKLTPAHTGTKSERRSSSVMGTAKASPSPLKPHLTGTPSKPTASSLAKARTPSTSATPAAHTTPSQTNGDITKRKSMSLGRFSGGKISTQRARQGTASPSPSPGTGTGVGGGGSSGARRRPSSVLGTSSGEQAQTTPSKTRSTTAPATTPSSSSGSRLLQGTAASRARAAAAQPHQPSSSTPTSTPSRSTPASVPGAKPNSTPKTPPATTATTTTATTNASRSKTPSSLRAKTPSTGRAKVKVQADGSNVHNPADAPKMPPVGKSPIGRLGLAAAGMKRPEGPEPKRERGFDGNDGSFKPNRRDGGAGEADGAAESGQKEEEEGVEEVRDIVSNQAQAGENGPDESSNGGEDPIQRPRTPSPGHAHGENKSTVNDVAVADSDVKDRGANVVIASPDQPLVDNNESPSSETTEDAKKPDNASVAQGNDTISDDKQESEAAEESLEEIPDIE
ncbi:hypothetical protein IAU59_001154 [Kwoniella sp. CBS 9459]